MLLRYQQIFNALNNAVQEHEAPNNSLEKVEGTALVSGRPFNTGSFSSTKSSESQLLAVSPRAHLISPCDLSDGHEPSRGSPIAM